MYSCCKSGGRKGEGKEIKVLKGQREKDLNPLRFD